MRLENKLAACVFTALLAFSALFLAVSTGCAATAQSGEANFKKYCEACHPNGGNVLRPTKNISKAVRERNGVKTADDIVKLIRKPGADMTAYDVKTLSEKDARNIADYVVKTFK